MLTHLQAGDLQDLHSEIQQQAAMLQNVSGLAEEVRHALVAEALGHNSNTATIIAWHRLCHSPKLGISASPQIQISLLPLH